MKQATVAILSPFHVTSSPDLQNGDGGGGKIRTALFIEDMPERGTANRFQSLRFVCWEACATRLYLSYDVWVIAETCDARYRSFDGTVACYELKGMGNDYSRPLSLPERGWFELNFLATAYNLLGALLREYNIRDPMSQRHEGQFRNCR